VAVRRSPVHRRRRAVALAGLAAGVLALLLVLGLTGGGDDDAREDSAAAQATPTPTPPPELPRGGRRLFPDYRAVAYYGAPQDAQLGELGIGTPAQAGRRLLRQAEPYGRDGRRIMPVMELIAVVAAAAPGEDGRYNIRQPDSVIRRYLRAARRLKALLVLDIQPGRSDFFTETVRLRKWLKEPDVGLALDAEWRVDPPNVPAQVIGHVGSREVNATTAWLSQLTRRRKLPEKLVIIHQFTDDMVPEQDLKRHPGLAYVLNADGFGSRAAKVSKYRRFARNSPEGFRPGFKLFYREDVGLMSPRRVMRLKPRPDVVIYE
jgi:hypothetical protein